MKYKFNYQQITTELSKHKKNIESLINSYITIYLQLVNRDDTILNRKYITLKELNSLFDSYNWDKDMVFANTTLDSMGGICVDVEMKSKRGKQYNDRFITVISHYEKTYSLWSYLFSKKELETKDIDSLVEYTINKITDDYKILIRDNRNLMLFDKKHNDKL